MDSFKTTAIITLYITYCKKLYITDCIKILKDKKTYYVKINVYNRNTYYKNNIPTHKKKIKTEIV
jgi:hypothetical protein